MIELNRNEKGFSIIELLIIIAVLGLLGFLGWVAYQRISQAAFGSDSTSVAVKPEALMYGYFDGLSMKVNSFSLLNKQKKLLFEQNVSESDTRSRADTVLKAQVSDDKQMVAYRFGDKGEVKIIKSDGSIVREVPRSGVASFAWRLNKTELILEETNYGNCDGINCEAPLNGFGSSWYLYGVTSGKETQLNMGNYSFNGLEGQSANRLYFAASSPYDGVSPKLYSYDLNNHKVNEVSGLPKDEGIQIGFISTSPSSKHTIISILPSDYGINNSCTIYELDGKKLGGKIVDNADFQCESAYWINDNEFYFDNSTGPSGKITTSDNSPSGYYVLLSVFKYSFSDKKQQKVLVSDGSEVYRLLDGLPDGSFVVSNEANERNPQYKLEIRSADGSLNTSVDSSQKEILLIGSVK